MNNLRAACQSHGLSDEADRLHRIRTFLGDHGITHGFARTCADNWMDGHANTLNRARDFAASLPPEPRHPAEGPSTFSTARGTTLDEILSELRDVSQMAPAEAQQLPDNARVVAKKVMPFVRSVCFCQKRRTSRQTRIDTLVGRVLREAENMA
ncbi:MAG: hypothetical protein ABI702_16910 [Burkholderiales bacterium]